jgi:hypothetical protein
MGENLGIFVPAFLGLKAIVKIRAFRKKLKLFFNFKSFLSMYLTHKN